MVYCETCIVRYETSRGADEIIQKYGDLGIAT